MLPHYKSRPRQSQPKNRSVLAVETQIIRKFGKKVQIGLTQPLNKCIFVQYG
jgi:hypothetical protein